MHTGNPMTENLETDTKPDLSSVRSNECDMTNISPYMSKGMIAAAGFNVETPIVNAIIGNLSGTLPTRKKECEMIKCEICDCELSSNTVLSAHMNGSKHQKRVKALEIIEQLKEAKDKGINLGHNDNPKAFKCEICSLTVNSAQQLEIHLSGAKHKKKAAKVDNSESKDCTIDKNLKSSENSVDNDEENKDVSASSGKEDTNPEGMPNEEVQRMIDYWEKFQSFAKKWHPSKDEVNKLFVLVEEQCLSYFKNILEKQEVQSSLDTVLTGPPTKKQKLANEEEAKSE